MIQTIIKYKITVQARKRNKILYRQVIEAEPSEFITTITPSFQEVMSGVQTVATWLDRNNPQISASSVLEQWSRQCFPNAYHSVINQIEKLYNGTHIADMVTQGIVLQNDDGPYDVRFYIERIEKKHNIPENLVGEET